MNSNKALKAPVSITNPVLIPLVPYTKKASVSWKEGGGYDLIGFPESTSYGILCGPSGIVVIDCDTKNGIDGVSSFLELATENGGVPQTLVVETPNEGLHYYFKATEGVTIKNSAGTKLGPGIDVRGEGGYIVGPGSAIRVTDEDGIEEVRFYSYYSDPDIELAPLPQWLEKLLLTAAPKPSANTSKPTKDEVKTPSSNPFIAVTPELLTERRNALHWALRVMSRTVEGEREDTLNRMSFWMGVKKVDERDARDLIKMAMKVGLKEREATLKFENGYLDGLKEAEVDFDVIVRKYNTEVGVSFKDDPMDTGFYTHLALSYTFQKSCPDDFIYSAWERCWYAYRAEEGRWVRVPHEFIVEAVDKFVEEKVLEIRKDNPKIPAHIYKAQEKLWLRSNVESIASFAQRRFMRIETDLFDQNPYLINVKNGTLNLRTGELEEHKRENFITHYIPIEWDPEAKDRMCTKILSSLDKDEREFMQVFAGQSLTGTQPRSQVALFLHGRGSNGKSTFLDLMLKTSGSYGKLLPPTVLAEDKQGGDKYALADFEGLRFVVVEELPDSKNLNSGALKRVVGTQKINSRRMYKDYHEFVNQATVFVSCNKLPMVTDTDDGTWRRMLVVHFPYSYKKSQSEVKSPYDRLGDARILNAAQNSYNTAKAFLAWRVEGALKWFNDEDAEYSVPDKVLESSDDWRDNNDSIRGWAREMLEYSRDSFITIEDLRATLNTYLVQRGNAEITQRHFIELFTNHSFFFENTFVFKKRSKVPKALTRSLPKLHDYHPAPTAVNATYVRGVRFKNLTPPPPQKS